jgi:hypothetical protein
VDKIENVERDRYSIFLALYNAYNFVFSFNQLLDLGISNLNIEILKQVQIIHQTNQEYDINPFIIIKNPYYNWIFEKIGWFIREIKIIHKYEL